MRESRKKGKISSWTHLERKKNIDINITISTMTLITNSPKNTN